jgi:hypothetical protein
VLLGAEVAGLALAQEVRSRHGCRTKNNSQGICSVTGIRQEWRTGKLHVTWQRQAVPALRLQASFSRRKWAADTAAGQETAAEGYAALQDQNKRGRRAQSTSFGSARRRQAFRQQRPRSRAGDGQQIRLQYKWQRPRDMQRYRDITREASAQFTRHMEASGGAGRSDSRRLSFARRKWAADTAAPQRAV